MKWILALILFLILTGLLLIPGCSTAPDSSPPEITQLVTPARVEAVTALGTFYGAKELLRDGNRAELARAREGLAAIQSTPKRDLVAIAAALERAGIAWMRTPEGQLAILAASAVFNDAYGPQVILDNRYADSILAGAIRGIDLAMAADSPGARSLAEQQLSAEAAATRPTT